MEEVAYEEPTKKGIQLVLADGSPVPEGGGSERNTMGEPLADAATQALLKRTDPLEGEDGDRRTFRIPAETLAAPKTGDITAIAAPSVQLPTPEVIDGPARVLRFGPEGEVPQAPKLSLTFSQPMVAVSSQEVTQETVPAVLEPQPEGTWRWLGTRTLVFEPTKRFPMATNYTVKVREGAHTATGEPVEAHSFSFATPPPQLVQKTVTPYQSTRPVVTLTFDQPVDPEVVRAHVQPRPEAALHLATPAEIEDRPTSDRTVHLAFDDALDVDTAYQIIVPPGLTGLEGPRGTSTNQGVAFRTHGALKLASGCERRRCSPGGALWIEATNPLDGEAYEQELITVDPPVEGMHSAVSWRNLQIYGDFAPRTTYTVTVGAGLTDTHGQTLGEPTKLKLTTGDVDPWLQYRSGPHVVLDPASDAPVLPVSTAGLDSFEVWIRRVSTDDLTAFHASRRSGKSPGELLAHTTVRIEDADRVTESLIELAPHLADGIGQLTVEVYAKKGKNQEWTGRSWVQGTHIGVDAFVDASTLWASTTDLSTGRALPGVTLTLDDQSATTDARGLARFALPDGPDANFLIAELGDDTAILPASRWGVGHWSARNRTASTAWFVFDDRGLYKPGETVRIHGLQRRIDPGPKGDVRATEARTVTWTATGPRREELGKGTVQVGPFGDFELSFDLPEGVNLGRAYVRLSAEGGSQTRHVFKIQEFRRPEFEVSASTSEGPHLLGTHATATVQASYYAGGGLAGAEARWWANGNATSYRPAGHDDFSFGEWSPWWWRGYGGFGHDAGEQYPGAELTGTTDGAGAHTVDVHFASGEPKPMQVTLNASVIDVNRQQLTANTSFLVHPSNRYVGLRMDKAFVQADDPLRVQVIATDIDGALQEAKVEVVAVREEWRFTKGEWKAQEAERHACSVTTGSDPVLCTFEPEESGRFTLTARVTDAAGRPNQSVLNAWVAGGTGKPTRRVELEDVLLIPDADTYGPGDTAEVFVQAPFAPADALVSIDRDGFVEVRRVKLDEPTTVVQVPIEGAMTPGVHVQVEVTGSAPRHDDAGTELPVRRPAFATGSIHLPIPPLHRTLAVQVEPRASGLRPGSDTAVDVTVNDATGQPLADAAVTLWAVDESLLTLGGYVLGDPIAPFYPQRGAAVSASRYRDLLVLAEPEVVMQSLGSASTGVGGGGVMAEGPAFEDNAPMSLAKRSAPGAAPPPPPPPMMEPAPEPEAAAPSGPKIDVRTDFRALAFWRGDGRTDANGKLTVSYTLPDSLTRYRIFAVASDASTRFGKGEANVTARNPLMVRPSPPRFLNFGDRFELPIVLQNQTDAPMTVQVAAQAANAVFLESLDQPGDPYEVGSMATGRTVQVPANDRIELRIPTSTDMVGTARFQVVASSGDFADAARFDLPVYTPATSEAFATYGVIDQGAIRQPVSTPGEVWTQFGGLDIDTSSTALQALTDAVIQLTDYPYGCSEQIASRVLALVALRDVLTAFEAADLPPPEALKKQLDQDLTRLAELQNTDGGFGFWKKGDESWPFVSLHVAHAVARAVEKGVQVPKSLEEGTRRYVAGAPNNLRHRYLTDASRRHLHAYALAISRMFGKPRASEAEALLKHELALEAKGWLLPTLHDAKSPRVPELLREILNRTDETAGNAHFVADYDEQDSFVVLASSRRLDGVLLDALIQVDRDSDLIPKVTSGLLAHRVRGHWGSTQENAWVLLALDRYFRTYEKADPAFVARAWLGDLYAGEAAFRGREVDTRRIHVPMGELTEHPSQDLIVQKQGEGRLYYRIGLRYAPKSLELEPADYGFTVRRRYEAIDDPADVRFEDGVWHVKKGATVRVVVEMAADARRYHVALADPLPAGFEPMNPELNGVAPTPNTNTNQAFSLDALDERPRPWWGRWYVHDNLRDQRAEAFAHIVYGGLYTYAYVARATTPGSFVVPPAKAEEMYHPETFGRSGTTRVNID